MALERDAYLYRAYIAQKQFRVVLDEITGSSPSELQPLKILAEYFANPGQREAIMTELQQNYANSDNQNFYIAAATMYCHENNLEAALALLNNAYHLECLALKLIISLKMHRVDLAKKVLKQMQERDDDATLTQLAQAWVNTSVGGEKLQDVYYILQVYDNNCYDSAYVT